MIEALISLKSGEYTKFNNGYATVVVKRCDLKDYSKLTDAERKLLVDFEEYVVTHKSDEFFKKYDVEFIDDVVGRYDINTIKGTPNTSI